MGKRPIIVRKWEKYQLQFGNGPKNNSSEMGK